MADVAGGNLNRIQILTPEGELCLTEIPDRAGLSIQLSQTSVATGVSQVFDSGYRAEDGTCFLWSNEGEKALRVELETE